MAAVRRWCTSPQSWNPRFRRFGGIRIGEPYVILTLSVVIAGSASRVIRGSVLSVKNEQYVDAALALGASHSRRQALAAELQRVLEVHGVRIQPCAGVADFSAADLAIWGAEDPVPQAVADSRREFFGDGFLQVVDAGAPAPTRLPNTGSGGIAALPEASGGDVSTWLVGALALAVGAGLAFAWRGCRSIKLGSRQK